VAEGVGGNGNTSCAHTGRVHAIVRAKSPVVACIFTYC
jgi:hypothetical protein